MAWLAPAALALGLLAAPIILLYMLRLRRREEPISSTMLWRELVRDRAANAPWQPLRRNLLLLLQLLILAALVLALARPALRLPGLPGGDLIILLDASASMQATDGARGTRFADATGEVSRLIDTLGGDRMTLIQVGRTPIALAAATNDRAALRRALAAAAPESTAADWPAAFTLAAGSVQGLGQPRVVIVSDGRLPEGLPALPGEMSFVPAGSAGENLALTALAARTTAQGDALLVTAANPGPTARSALLSLLVDGVLYDSRRLEIAAGGQTTQNWLLPGGAAEAEARLEPRDDLGDFLPLDDRAWVVLSAGGERRVLLVGEGNLFLERLFAVLPGYELFRATAEEAAALNESGESYDLTVYDSVALPDGPLPGNSLVFNPQPAAGATAPVLTAGGVFTDTAVVRVADSPLLENVEWSATVAEARQVDAPALEPLIEAEGGPLLMAGEVGGRRVAVFTFDLRASDLPLQIAFPVIMANITAWLSPGRVITDENPQPGATVTILPDARATTVAVTQPDGATWEQAVVAGEPVAFAETEQTGIYRVSLRDAAGETRPAGAFAVNFLDADESHILPATTLRLGEAEVVPGDAALTGWRELWPWLVAAGLVVLLLEWWITYRRGRGRPLFRTR